MGHGAGLQTREGYKLKYSYLYYSIKNWLIGPPDGSIKHKTTCTRCYYENDIPLFCTADVWRVFCLVVWFKRMPMRMSVCVISEYSTTTVVLPITGIAMQVILYLQVPGTIDKYVVWHIVPGTPDSGVLEYWGTLQSSGVQGTVQGTGGTSTGGTGYWYRQPPGTTSLGLARTGSYI